MPGATGHLPQFADDQCFKRTTGNMSLQGLVDPGSDGVSTAVIALAITQKGLFGEMRSTHS